MKRLFLSFVCLILILSSNALHSGNALAAEVRTIEFPANGVVTFQDDFGDPRNGGKTTHKGIDIMGKKMTPLVAAVDGRVQYLVDPQASWGYEVVLEDSDDYTYHYIHINNDTPGTDDGNGGTANAYAPGITRGVTVSKGQLIAWMGDSGDAENVGSHLHFEIHSPDGTAINPYQSLLQAHRQGGYDPAAEMAASATINSDKDIATNPFPALCTSGDLIKSSLSTAAYYCGADSKRYVFPNQQAFFTWYKDFSSVKTISAADLAAIPLGKNVTYRPGTRLIKIQTDPKVYAISKGGTLRWVVSPEIAASLYGSDWAKKLEDIPEVFFTDYTIGSPITSS